MNKVSKNWLYNELKQYTFDTICDSRLYEIEGFENLDLSEFDYYNAYEEVVNNAYWFESLEYKSKYTFRQYIQLEVEERYDTLLYYIEEEDKKVIEEYLTNEDFEKITYELINDKEYKKEIAKLRKYFELVKFIKSVMKVWC